MIEGVVNAAYEAVVVLAVYGSSGQATEIEAIIDTGFTGFLTVTPALAAELELSLEGASRATLADGSEVTFDLYDVAVLCGTASRNMSWPTLPIRRLSWVCACWTATT